MAHFKIVYYGNDRKLINFLLQEKDEHSFDNFFLDFYSIKPDQKHDKLYEIITSSSPDLLLLDLSLGKELKAALHILSLEISRKELSLIGLWRKIDREQALDWRFQIGVDIHFCYQINNSSTLEDLFLGLCRYLGETSNKYAFYNKTLNRPAYLNTPVRVNFFTPKKIQIETLFPLEKGDIIPFDYYSISNFPFKHLLVQNISQLNLSYPLDYKIDLDYVFYDDFHQLYQLSYDDFDEIEFIENVITNPIVEKYIDENQIQDVGKNLSKNQKNSKRKQFIISKLTYQKGTFFGPERLKNLIIDSSFEALKSSFKPLWEYPYHFWLVATLEDHLHYLNTCGASLITYVINNPIDENDFPETPQFIQLKTICMRLKNNLKNLRLPLPTLQLYNISIPANILKEILDYSNLVVIQEVFTYERHHQFIKKFVQSKEYRQHLHPYGQDKDRVSPNAFSEEAHAFLKIETQLISLSESEIVFESKKQLKKNQSFMIQLGDNLRVYATIFYKVEDRYHALVNTLSEEEKKMLRQFLYKG